MAKLAINGYSCWLYLVVDMCPVARKADGKIVFQCKWFTHNNRLSFLFRPEVEQRAVTLSGRKQFCLTDDLSVENKIDVLYYYSVLHFGLPRVLNCCRNCSQGLNFRSEHHYKIHMWIPLNNNTDLKFDVFPRLFFTTAPIHPSFLPKSKRFYWPCQERLFH